MFRKWLNERIFNCRFGVRNALDSLAEDIFSILNAILCRIVFRDEFQMQTIAFDRETRFHSFFFFTRHNCTLRKEFDFVLEIFAHFFFRFNFSLCVQSNGGKLNAECERKTAFHLSLPSDNYIQEIDKTELAHSNRLNHCLATAAAAAVDELRNVFVILLFGRRWVNIPRLCIL